MRSRLAVCSLIAFVSCSGPGGPPQAHGEGRGLLSADATPPVGASVYERPTWKVGQQFTLLRGGIAKATFVVEEAGPDGYWLGVGGMRMKRDIDLGNLGDWEGDKPVRELTPRETLFHWPLWVGKRWSCEYVDSISGGPSVRVEAKYLVEGLDTVTVPAGTFEALRVCRTVRFVDAGPRVLQRTHLIWYAPSIGMEVRQVHGDSEVVLVDHAPG